MVFQLSYSLLFREVLLAAVGTAAITAATTPSRHLFLVEINLRRHQ